ncbi:hypothetical protein EYF80_052787 [Liparis tanakae]|uniref:Uncharacterized protein n=1 Tax=Liparis tanakae TaxID=230148 RepID=A0A4Z2F8A8_9TELE|nr:hypothetical protein EYF80_052787 [Liparis tanakae]
MFHALYVRLDLLDDPGLSLRLLRRATPLIDPLGQSLDVPLGVQQSSIALTSRNLWNAGLASLAMRTASLALRKLSMYAEYMLARVSLENWRTEQNVSHS